MIPKIIHYCWFGKNPLPPTAKKCIESWKKYCPGYEIIEWNETNFNLDCCDYVREAYEAKKWAFVADYARFKILYEHGGLYFDTDVELIKTIEHILKSGGFMGCELDPVDGRGITVAPGLGLAVSAGHELYYELMKGYHDRHFVDASGNMDLTTIVEYTTEILLNHGLQQTQTVQCIQGINIYPKEYFCPKDVLTRELHITPKTVAIHHFDGSWLPNYDKVRIKVREKLGWKITQKIVKVKRMILRK